MAGWLVSDIDLKIWGNFFVCLQLGPLDGEFFRMAEQVPKSYHACFQVSPRSRS